MQRWRGRRIVRSSMLARSEPATSAPHYNATQLLLYEIGPSFRLAPAFGYYFYISAGSQRHRFSTPVWTIVTTLGSQRHQGGIWTATRRKPAMRVRSRYGAQGRPRLDLQSNPSPRRSGSFYTEAEHRSVRWSTTEACKRFELHSADRSLVFDGEQAVHASRIDTD
jgi:hypothetical protein